MLGRWPQLNPIREQNINYIRWNSDSIGPTTVTVCSLHHIVKYQRHHIKWLFRFLLLIGKQSSSKEGWTVDSLPWCPISSLIVRYLDPSYSPVEFYQKCRIDDVNTLRTYQNSITITVGHRRSLQQKHPTEVSLLGPYPTSCNNCIWTRMISMNALLES